MITLGFTTLIDALSWVIVLSLSLKLIATLILLGVSKDVRDRPGWGSILWWSTKITPVIAVPCMIAVAMLQRMESVVWIFLALMVFVVIAVPLKIRQRRNRIAMRKSAKPVP